jgi:dihydrofolate synthase/folylpolyglutamate synthase
LTPDYWINKFFGKEYFSGEFSRLKNTVLKLDLFPTRNQQVITIAGTNGKGQTSRMLCALLDRDGIDYCLWTSPHLIKINERFIFNGHEIDDETLLKSFEEIFEKTRKLQLSYFEFLYVVFLKLVQIQKPEVIVQEVGLGGRLDATNILNAQLACITSISRDHQDLLGKRYRDIFSEKAGIFRDESKVVTCLELKYLRQKASRLRHNKQWTDLFESGEVKKFHHFSKRNSILAGELFFQSQGKRVDLGLIDNFECMRKKVAFGDASFELFPTHNVDGLRKLVQFLKQEQYTNYNKVIFGPSSRQYEDLLVMARILISTFGLKNIKLAKFDHYKSLDKKQFNQLESEFNFGVIEDIQKVKESQTAGKYMVLGSN